MPRCLSLYPFPGCLADAGGSAFRPAFCLLQRVGEIRYRPAYFELTVRSDVACKLLIET